MISAQLLRNIDIGRLSAFCWGKISISNRHRNFDIGRTLFPITTTAEYAPSYLQHAVRCQRMKSSKNPAAQISAHAGNTDFRVYHHAVDVVERTVIIDLPDKNGVEVPVIVNWIVT